jgi:hypothetical protein
MPRYSLVLALSLLLAFPTLAAVRAGSERELAARQLDVASFDQRNGHIATDGSSFLTVWEDNLTDVLGARLDPNGTLVDVTPLVVQRDAVAPEIAWGRDRYLAVWQTPWPGARVRGRFVERDGTMGEPFDIGARTHSSVGRTLLAFNGQLFLVMWYDTTWRGAMIDLAGSVVREITGPYAHPDAALGALDETFYFAYGALLDRDMQAHVVTIDGTGRLGTTVPVGEPAQLVELMQIRARNHDLLVAWSSGQGRRLHDVRVTRQGIGSVETIEVDFKWLQSVVVDGFDYLLVYGDSGQTLARRAGATTVASFPIPAPSYAVMSDAATAASRIMTVLRVYDPFRVIGGDLYVAPFGETAVTPLAVGPHHQAFPHIAATGEVKLAAWLEHKPAEQRLAIVATRVDRGGHALDPQPRDLGSADLGSAPYVATNGDGWLVIWRRGSSLYAVRFAGNGTPLDPEPLRIGNNVQGTIAAAWDGGDWVVVFSSGPRFHFAQVHAVRVPASGTPAEPFRLAAEIPTTNAVIAAGTNGSLIVWNFGTELRGVLLSRNDVVTPLAFHVPISFVTGIAWNRDTFLITAIESGGQTIRALRVDAFGNLSTIPWSLQSSAVTSPRVSPLGEDFLIVWKDGALRAVIVDRAGNLVSGVAAISPEGGTAAPSDGLIVSAHPIGHPSRNLSRVFAQTIERTGDRRRRAVR